MKCTAMALATAVAAVAASAQPNLAQAHDWNGGPGWMGPAHQNGQIPQWRIEQNNAGSTVRFTLRRGHDKLDVRCPSGPQMRACFDAVGDLIDDIRDKGPLLGGPGHHPPPAGGPGHNPQPHGGPDHPPPGGQQGNSGPGNPPPPNRT